MKSRICRRTQREWGWWICGSGCLSLVFRVVGLGSCEPGASQLLLAGRRYPDSTK